VLLAGAAFCAGAAPRPTLGVLFPDVGAPYGRIFEQILGGIEDATGANTVTRRLDRYTEPAEVARWAQRHDLDAVVTLGRGPLSLARAAGLEQPVIAGAATFTPDDTRDIDALSLVPAPDAVFRNLVRLAPRVERINVVYEPGRDDWLVQRATAAASAHDLELRARSARDLAASAVLHRDVMSEQAPHASVWLLRNERLVDDRTVLPLVLEQSWQRHWITFSNDPASVKRGVLFALYPDQRGMGQRLARMAQDRIDRPERPHRLALLDSVRIAVNVRTASHLGLHFTAALRRQFDIVFPSP